MTVSSSRRTKIVCTMGPSTSPLPVIEGLIKAGMNMVRLNLSHGSSNEHASYVSTVREVAAGLGAPVGVMIDLPGSKFRFGNIEGGSVTLREGERLVLTTRPVAGNDKVLPVNLASFTRVARSGDTILVDDGAMQFKVEEIRKGEIISRVLVGGEVSTGRGLAVPGRRTAGPYVTEQLENLLEFAVSQNPDWLALSFVRCPEDIEEARSVLRRHGSDIPVLAKIERGEAVTDFDRILAVSDGVMVARGDLGVDIPLPSIPLVQKEIIHKCNRAGKPVITATQMLESMIKSPEPTRAEVTDVANAIFDGTDAIMLSAETAIGKYPVRTVEMMAKIALAADGGLPYDLILRERAAWRRNETDEVIAYSACNIAHELGAAAIVAFTRTGSTAMRVAKYRPKQPILAISPVSSVCDRLLLSWGVSPLQIAHPATVDELFTMGARLAVNQGFARAGDRVVITAGIPIGLRGTTNLVKVETVGT